MLNVFKIRVVRTGKMTLIAAIGILTASVLFFNFFANMIYFMSSMMRLDFGEKLTILVRYGVPFVALLACMYCLLSGEWDLNYKLIARHLEKKKNKVIYEEVGTTYEKIESIKIHEKDGDTVDINMLNLLKVYELEKRKILFCCINGIYMVIRDISLIDIDADTLKITKYKYIGKALLNNKNLYGYKFELIKNKDETLSTNNAVQFMDEEYQKYFEHAMIVNETDLKDSHKEDMSEGARFALKVMAFLMIVGTGVKIYNFCRVNIEKTVLETTGLVAESSICGVKVLFDDEQDSYLMPYINKSLAQINPEILEDFVEKEWMIRITNEDMESNGIYFGLKDTGPISGATSTPYKYIIIPADIDSIDGSVIHEMGHFVDSWKYTTSKEWIEIYEEEKESYIRKYARSNPFEGFACAYMEYVIVNEGLKWRCPKTHEFIQNILQDKYGIE